MNELVEKPDISKRKRAPAGCMKRPTCEGTGKRDAFAPGSSEKYFPDTVKVECIECGGAEITYNPASPKNADYESHLADLQNAQSY